MDHKASVILASSPLQKLSEMMWGGGGSNRHMGQMPRGYSTLISSISRKGTSLLSSRGSICAYIGRRL